MADLSDYTVYENTNFEVLTDTGFQDFMGIIVGKNQNKIVITTENGKSITCTPKHKFVMKSSNVKFAKDLTMGDILYNDDIISGIKLITNDELVYELLEVDGGHKYLCNNMLCKNCLVIDEMSHIPPHILSEFWNSVIPVISSSKSTKLFVVSTPNGTGNLFHKIYTGAERGDEEFSQWHHDRIDWWEFPGRDEQWAKDMRSALAGQGKSFEQEFGCLGGETEIAIRKRGTNDLIYITLEMLYTDISHAISSSNSIIKLSDEYEVLTPTGFQPFSGIRKLKKKLYKVQTKSHQVECSYDHPFSINGKIKKYSELVVGDMLKTKSGLEPIIRLTELDSVQDVYDLIEVENGNVYYTNDIVSHNCEFIETGQSAVDSALLDSLRHLCRDPEFVFEDGHYKVWEAPQEGHLYVIGVDVGEGIGQAASVAQILDVTDLTDIRLVASYHDNRIDPFHFGGMLAKIANQWGRPMLAIERNNCGGQVIDALKETHGYHNIIDHAPKTQSTVKNYYARLGIYASSSSRYSGVINMRYWVNSLKVVKIYDIALVQELETFVRYPNGTWRAKAGDYMYDDRVMALVWGLFVLEPEVASKYYEIEKYDKQGKPLKITSPDVVDAGYFQLNQMFTDDPNSPLPIAVNPGYGVDENGIDALMGQGWIPYDNI